MMKLIKATAILILGGFLASSSFAADEKKAEGESTPRPDTLHDSLMQLSSAHPRVRLAAARLAGALRAARFEGRRYPDPRLGIAWSNAPYKRDLRFIKDQTPMTGIEWRLTQAIIFPGRLSVGADIADLNAGMLRLELAMEKNRIAREFLAHLIRAEALAESIKLTRGYEERLRVTAEAARTRYSVGRGSLADVSRAELRHAAYQDRILRLEGELAGLHQALRYYVSDHSHWYAGRQLTLYLKKLEAAAAAVPELSDTTSLRAARESFIMRAREKKRTLAKMQYLPDFEVFAAYRKRAFIRNDPAQGEDFMSFGLTVRVPLWSALANSPNIDAAEEELRMARYSIREALLAENAKLSALRQDVMTLDRRLTLYEENLVPRARRSQESTRSAYETGRVDIEAFLGAWDALFALELEQINLRAERAQRVLQVAELINVILPAYDAAQGDEK